MPGFQPQVWRLTQPDTLAVRNTKIQVDGQGKAWVAWSFVATEQWMEYERFGHLTTLVGVQLAELDADGLAGPPVPLLPLGDYYAWMYDIAIGPHSRLWCALGMLSYESYYEEESSRDWDYLFRISVSPCGESPRTYEELPLPGDVENQYRLGFMDGEPVLVDGIQPLGGGPVVHWVGSDSLRKVPGSGNDGFRSPTLSRAGPALAMLWSASYKVAGSGGVGDTYKYVSILHSDDWLTSRFSAETWRYGEGHPIDRYVHLYNYIGPKAIGSDGRSRVFVFFEEDSELETEPGDNLGLYIAETVPQVRTYDIASADIVDEWTLGYTKLREKLPNSTRAAITSNHNAVGFAISRSGKLDLWVLVDESWYGPYPIVSGSSGSARLFPDIAVDADGRYWLAWDDGADVYAAMVTPADLGLEYIATAVSTAAIDDRSLPATPTLGQNSPNPFNAQTAIEVHIPAAILGDTAIDIFNLGGQLVRSLAMSRGSTRVTWDGTSGEGLPVASGVYLYRLRVGERTWALRRMVLVR